MVPPTPFVPPDSSPRMSVMLTRTLALSSNLQSKNPSKNMPLPPRTIWRFLSAFIFLIFAVTVYLATLRGETYVAPNISLLIYASALYYVALSAIALTARPYYWAVLPLIVLSVPNAVNDLLPSALMGPEVPSIDTPAFPLFTHIDIFLLLGILRYGDFFASKRILITGFLFLSASILVLSNYLTGAWHTDGIYGLYQLRYAIFLYVAFTQIGFNHAHRPFVFGLAIAMTVTLIETIAYSYLTEPPGHLLSGNLGKNPLGHVGAATFCFFFFLRSPNAPSYFRFVALGITAFLMAGSGTRFSIVSAFFAITMTYLLRSNLSPKKISMALIGTLVGFALLSTTPQGASIAQGVARVSESISAPDYIERTPESSSMVTRLHVWQGTIDMASAHWLVGVGPGNWSFMKRDFHIPYDGLLDPHNDFLNFIVSYGIFFGGVFYLTILVVPLLAARHAAFHQGDSFLQAAFASVLCIALTGLTNATLWKHSVFALTSTFALALFLPAQTRLPK